MAVTQAQKIQGGDMHLFVKGKSIGFATNHTLTISGSTTSTSNKDEGGDSGWSSEEVNQLSFTASTENLYSLNAKGNNFDDLFDLMIAKTPIECIFCKKNETGNEVPEGGWTPVATPKSGYKGKMVITNLQLNCQNGEFSKFTAEFKGVGPLEKLK